MDSTPSFKNGGWSGEGPSLRRGQYCQFEVKKVSETQSCLSYKGYLEETQLMEFDTCGEDFYGNWKKHEEKWKDLVDTYLADKLEE